MLTLKKKGYRLSPETVDLLSQEFADSLTEAEADRKDILRLRLSLEEILESWSSALPGAPVTFCAKKRLGRQRIEIRVEGKELQADDVLENCLLSSRLLAQAGHSLRAEEKQMTAPKTGRSLVFLFCPYIRDRYKFLISSKVGSFGLPGRHASSIADCARKSTSSALTIAFKSAGIPTSADSFLTASTAALRYSSWLIFSTPSTPIAIAISLYLVPVHGALYSITVGSRIAFATP